MSDPRVTRAAAALTDGHPDTALSLLGTARGFDADLLRIEALQFHDPAGALPAVVRRARKRATTGDEVARLLEVRARPHGGARRESMLHEALELAEAPTLRARLMVDLGHRRLVVTDTDDAERWLRRAEAEGVGSDAVCELEHLRGVIHLHRGQQEEAIAAFSRGLTQAGDRVLATILALRARARCWASLEREADAQSDYERALALTKGRAALREERAKLLNSLADMARLAGDLDGAARRFHALLDMKLPFITPVVHLNLALVEHARGDGARARHHLDQVFVDGTHLGVGGTGDAMPPPGMPPLAPGVDIALYDWIDGGARCVDDTGTDTGSDSGTETGVAPTASVLSRYIRKPYWLNTTVSPTPA